MSTRKRGFTLLELLIVIAILAILSAVTIIVLNPAELLRKSRDSQRLSDISSIKTALGFYIVTTSTIDLDSTTPSATDRCVGGQGPDSIFTHRPGLNGVVSGSFTYVGTAVQTTGGSGWIPTDLLSLQGGSPLPKYPIDPSNRGGNASGFEDDFYYTYACRLSDQTFEINANVESAFYRAGGTGDIESTDGGDIATIFEDGTALNILPSATSSTYFAGE
jgi:prepilin-type N-terminal cleavage/methylation domain-containing protein